MLSENAEVTGEVPGAEILGKDPDLSPETQLLWHFAHAPSRRAFLDSAVSILAVLTGCRCVGIRAKDEDRNIPYESYTGFGKAFWESENWLSLDRDHCACLRVARGTPEPQDLPLAGPYGSYRCNDFQDFAERLAPETRNRFRGACVRAGFRSVALMPIRRGETFLGLIHLADRRPGMVEDPIIEKVRGLSVIVAEALNKYNLEDALRRGRDTETVTNSLLGLLVEETPVEDVLDRALEAILSNAWFQVIEGACIFLSRKGTELLDLKVQKGMDACAGKRCRTLPVGRGLCGEAALSREVRFGRCLDGAAACGTSPGGNRTDDADHAHYCVPILARGEVLGVINVRVGTGHLRHGREEVFLRAVANALSGIIIRKDLENRMVESETRYRAIVETQTELVSRFTPDGRLTFVNDAYCRYFGEPADGLIGSAFWHHLPVEDAEALRRYMSGFSPASPVSMIEHRVTTRSGEERWQQWTDRAIFDSEGEIIEFQAVGRDITRRMHAEKALRESEERLRLLSLQILKAQERERKRIANELHDSISQTLSAIKFRVEDALRRIETQRNPEAAAASLDGVVGTVQYAIDEVRRIMTDLRPSILDDLGVVATLNWFSREFRKTYTGIDVTMQVDIAEEEIPQSLKLVIFRVVQEAMNNIAKHSGATAATITLARDNSTLHLSIADNGRGFDPAEVRLALRASGTGVGLSSIRERVEGSNGAFLLETRIDHGTRIRALWNLDRL